MPAGCRCRLLLFACLSAHLLGCRSNPRQDHLENELRSRDNQVRELLDELGKSELRGDALRREVGILRKGIKVPPEVAGPSFGLRRITLARGTGGADNDTLPGDEALAVYVEPRDIDDHVIKVPGSKLQVLVLEITPQGLKAPLYSWNLDAEQLRQTWKEGLLSTGYQLNLPWKVFPRTENLRVVARLILTDERVFEADKDVKVRLVPGKSLADPSCPLPSEVGPPFLPPPPTEVGPPPRTLSEPTSLLPTPAGHWRPADGAKVSVEAARWTPASLVGAVQLGTPTTSATAPPPLP